MAPANPSSPRESTKPALTIRLADERDHDDIWHMLEPVVRAGETYTLERDMGRDAALAFWFAPGHEVFIALDSGEPAGTYFLRANHAGGGAHVANCGYITAPAARHRGVGTAMCAHSLERARSRGFRAMQYNFVVSTNESAVRLWERCGFAIVGRLAKAFCHPRLGYVDALVMYLQLEP